MRTLSLLPRLPSRAVLCVALVGALTPACKKSTPETAAPEFATAAQAIRSPLDNSADLYLGQYGGITNALNYAEARSLNSPGQMALDTSVSPPRLYLADPGNNRVLAWADAASFATGAPADKVFGFTSFDLGSIHGIHSNCEATPSASSLCHPSGVAVDPAGNLFVADTGNDRVLEFEAPFATDTVADLLFGQANFASNGCNKGGISPSTLCTPVSLALDSAGALYVADQGNFRVLKYDAARTSETSADYVLGQSGFTGNQPAFPEARGLRGPGRLAVDRSVTPNRLWVTDQANNRVLGYTTTAFVSGQSPSVVLGQPGFITVSANNPALSASSLKNPTGVAVDAAGNVFVADSGNHRVLGYLNPFATDPVADKVWGQGLFTTAVAGASSIALSSPSDVHVNAAGELFVADTGNNRVLMFTGAADLAADAVADRVWGQQGSFTGKSCNLSGRAGAEALCSPRAVTTDAAGDLYVVDYNNHRVLRFDGQVDTVADQVFGQGSMDLAGCNYSGLSASSLCSPSSVAVGSDGTVWIGDSGNNRALAFRAAKTTDAVADVVLGRPDFGGTVCTRTSGSCYEDASVSVALDAADNLFVGLEQQYRVLRYDDPLAEGSDLLPEAVLGQPNLTTRGRNFPDTKAIDLPVAVAIDRSVSPNRLYVADQNLHRVAVWHSVDDLQHGMAADAWIGQPDGQSGSAGPEVSNGASLYGPSGLAVDAAGNLYVSDGENNRVLVFNRPFAGGDAVADVVVGQSSMTSTACNGGAMPSASTLCQPAAVLPSPNGTTLWVGDTGNQRVLRYDGFPADTVADAALGQLGMTTRAPNLADAMSLYEPLGVAIDRSVRPNRIFVADTRNSRVLGWSNLDAVSSGAPADLVIGQVDFLQSGCNLGGRSASTLCEPNYVRVDGRGRLWVSDALNHRVLLFNDPFGTDTVADKVLGQPDFASGQANQGGGPTAVGLNGPRGLDVDPAGNVWVADRGNHRVLLFLDPANTDATADKVIGQAELTAGQCNKGNSLPSQDTLCQPAGVRVDTSESPYFLWIADHTNDRVLRYDNALAGDTLPDQLVGAQNYTDPPLVTETARKDNVSSSKLITPLEVMVDHAGNLYVAEEDPDRVLFFKNPRLEDGAAELVFGQVSFNRRACNMSARVSASSLCGPWALDYDEYGSVWLADRSNNRIVSYSANTVPTATNLLVGPASPLTADHLQLSYTFLDPENDLEGGTIIRWYRNGEEQPALQGTKTVPAEQTSRGDSWHATVRPKDGLQFGPLATSPKVTVGNTRPVASALDLSPAAPTTGDVLSATYVYSDEDGDPENGSVIRWYRNNLEELALLNAREVPASATEKNDLWYFKVEPRDGTDSGLAQSSTPIQIGNSPPIAGTPLVSPSAPRVTDSLTATYTYLDPDDDAQLGPQIRWFRGGLHQPQFDDFTTVPGPFVFGDTWYFTIKPRDGVSFGALVTSPAVSIVSSPPVASALQITPFAPETGDTLTANYSFSDPDGQTEAGSELKWFRNGEEMPALAGLRVVPASETTKGDQWHFALRPRDGALFGTLQTSPVATIGNTLPVVTSPTITPVQPTTVDPLRTAYAYQDADGDLEQGTEIRWFKNGIEQVAYAGLAELPASATQKREVWFYRVRPNDGLGFGGSETSAPVFIANSAPTAAAGEDRTQPASGTLTRVSLDGSASSDVDGDLLAYTWLLADAPVATGVRASIELPVGQHKLVLSVSDGEASATDELVLTVGDPAPTVTVEPGFSAAPGRVALSGSATDVLHRELRYAWSQVAGEPAVLADTDRPTASFFAIKAGPRTFQLVVTPVNGETPSAPATVTVTTRDEAPLARVPARRVVQVGVPAAIEAPESSDPNGESLTYQWSVAGGPGDSTLADAEQPVARFTALADGVYDLQLVVSDGVLSSAPATLKVLALDPALTTHAPLADAGPDGAGEVDTAFGLDATRSFDADGDALSFDWQQKSGPEGTLLAAEKAVASFLPKAAGTFEFVLKVTDAKGQSAEDTVTFEVLNPRENRRPLARIVEPAVVEVQGTVTLDGSRSQDPDADPLTYEWTQLEGVPVQLASATAANASFTVTRPGTLVFQLVVSDGKVRSLPARVTLYAAGKGNARPIANAGADQSVMIGRSVTLDGTGSSDPEGSTLRYVWEQVLGAPVALSGEARTPTFTPPGRGLYRFRLMVWDEQSPGTPDEVDVVIGTHGSDNKAPIAIARGSSEATVGDEIRLDGTASYDPDPTDQISFRWRPVGFPTGAEPTLTNGGAATATFQPAVAGLYSFALVVSDGDLESAPAYQTVAVTSEGRSGCSAGGSGALLWPLGVVLALALGLGPKRRRA